MKDWSWKFFGQLFSAQNQLFSLIRGTFEPMKIGAEIIPWILDEGKEVFVASLKELGEKFLAQQRVRVIDENTVMVNLDAPPRLPFEGATVEKKAKSIVRGWVRVEKREDGLYVDGRKIIFHLSDRQQGEGSLTGKDLRQELSAKPVQHPNVMDAAVEYNLFTEDWKADEAGNTRYTYFWDEIFRDSDGDLYVRCVCWGGGQWYVYYLYLVHRWDAFNPAAVSAS